MYFFQVVRASPDHHIKWCVATRPPLTGGDNTAGASFEEVVASLLADLHMAPDTFPKTIVFTKLKWCGLGHEMAIRPPHNSIDVQEKVAQYHAPCSSQVSYKAL